MSEPVKGVRLTDGKGDRVVGRQKCDRVPYDDEEPILPSNALKYSAFSD